MLAITKINIVNMGVEIAEKTKKQELNNPAY